MRLVKLTLAGFKSFADKTEFTFDDPVTGIVGPNGCGKSNVVDAIKWVLGERSSKSLRGQEMIDVIFAGSAARQPLGMASVALTFENPVLREEAPTPAPPPAPALAADAPEDAGAEPAPQPDMNGAPTVAPGVRRRLPIDADIVEIERRLYRDGGSEYLINGRVARLKDIRDMFLDTGVGADAYSIIEQGKVDAMLLASPQERRVIFEEAAGIAKYKQRRIEAQRKLERTEANLRTTREQLDSTERRLRLVRGQAAKARRFVELDADFRAWRLALAFDQYDDLEQRLAGLTSRQATLHAERDAAGALVAATEASRAQAEQARHDLNERVAGLEQSRLEAEHLRQQSAQRRAMLERALEETTRQAALDADRLAESNARHGETESAIHAQRESLAAVGERLAEAERTLDAAGSQRAECLKALNRQRAEASRRQSNAQRMERERVQLLGAIAGEARRAESIREQCDRLAQRLAALRDDQQRAQHQAGEVAAAAAAADEGASTLTQELTLLEEQVGRLSTDRRERAERVGHLEQELARLDGRRATLQEMVQTRAGFGEGVRAIMERREAGDGFAGVLAPLADLIETLPDVDAAAAGAVASALGADMEGLVVATMNDLPSRAELDRVGGRVTFLPMSGVSTGLPMPSEEFGTILSKTSGIECTDPAGRLVSLRSMIRPRGGDSADPRLFELLDRLLARTFLVRDLEAAMLLAGGPMAGHRVRFVTRDGALLDADGRVTTGRDEAAAGAGLLARHQELESLTQGVHRLTTTLEAEREVLRGVDAEAAVLTARQAEVRTRLSMQQRAAQTEHARAERLGADVARLAREAGGIEQEATQLRHRLATIDADRAALQERADSLGRLHEEEAAAAASLDAEVRGLQARADAALEQVSGARVEVGRLNEQAGNVRRELARLELQRDGLARAIRDAGVQAERHVAAIEEHRAGIADAAGAGETAAADTARLARDADEARSALAAALSRAAELSDALAAARQRLAICERDWHSLEVSRRELEVKRENLQERTQEEIAIDLRAEHPEYRAMMAGGDVARIDTNEAARNIETLREAIRRLGSVNMDALTEETLLEEQNQDLVRQVADIDAARGQLVLLIDQLNVLSRARFGEVFARIQQHFGGETGMFRKLFGGGKAEVRLMPLVKDVENPDGTTSKVETDEIDVLESGVEVVAKPPGKEPRSISQLSGGEKTLTAVALLMSIFRSKPSCFCVLDEVDAALDEGNVARFNQAVRDFTDLSRFIVITHNKRTMQSADRLYGVTMQERGVSTRVSVKFEKSDAATATTPAPAQAPPHHAPTPREAPVVHVAPDNVLDAIVQRRAKRESPATTSAS